MLSYWIKSTISLWQFLQCWCKLFDHITFLCSVSFECRRTNIFNCATRKVHDNSSLQVNCKLCLALKIKIKKVRLHSKYVDPKKSRDFIFLALPGAYLTRLIFCCQALSEGHVGFIQSRHILPLCLFHRIVSLASKTLDVGSQRLFSVTHEEGCFLVLFYILNLLDALFLVWQVRFDNVVSTLGLDWPLVSDQPAVKLWTCANIFLFIVQF